MLIIGRYYKNDTCWVRTILRKGESGLKQLTPYVSNELCMVGFEIIAWSENYLNNRQDASLKNALSMFNIF